jgi:hypothetical protein
MTLFNGMRISEEIQRERMRAHAKHGDGSIESHGGIGAAGLLRFTILTEEVGEVAKEFNEAALDGRDVDRARLRAELIQVAAVTVAWIDRLDRESGRP